jgi:hypothetical protein
MGLAVLNAAPSPVRPGQHLHHERSKQQCLTCRRARARAQSGAPALYLLADELARMQELVRIEAAGREPREACN